MKGIMIMKKRRNRAAAFLLSSIIAVSACGMAAFTASADDSQTYSITMSTTTGHTYSAYQIFTGDLYEEGSGKKLSNIKWGNGVDSTGLVSALKSDSTYGAEFTTALDGIAPGSDKEAAAVAKQIASYTNEADAKALATIIGAHTTTAESQLTGLDAGYYLIKDTTDQAAMPEGDTYSNFMLEVVSDVEVTAKDETVSSDKTVSDINDSTGAEEAGKDTADYDIGDDIPYVLTFTLPSKYDEYEKYPITFVDDMCAGLTYNGDARIWYGEVTGEGESITFTWDEEATSETGGKVYKAEIEDLKAVDAVTEPGTVITIKYTAKLNSNAVIGNAGNLNKYNVIFANDPTWTSDGGTTEPPTGETPKVTNTVFTYKLIVNKQDPDKNALTGADFELYKFIKGEGTDTYDGQTGTWTVVTGLNSGSVNPAKEKSASGDVADSVFTFKGIDDGIYKLVETVTPEGYNTIDDIIFTVAPNADGDLNDITIDDLKFTSDDAAGSLTGNIVNESGIILPGTGGIGTTLFYIIGGALVAGSVILLITKKRMNSTDD